MNNILNTTKEKILDGINPKGLIQAIEKVTEAGRKILYSPKTRDMVMQELQSEGDVEDVIGSGVAKLTGLVFNEYKKTLPMEVLMPVSMMLLLEVLDFLEQAGKIKVTNEMLAETTQTTASAMLQLLGITPEMLEEAMSQSGQTAQGAQTQVQSGLIGSEMGAA